jgi:hypothetical protein
MTDKQWQKIITKTVKSFKVYQANLEIAEQEYIRRYGHTPTDVDDDTWIDTVHYGYGSHNVEDFKASAESRKERI